MEAELTPLVWPPWFVNRALTVIISHNAVHALRMPWL